MDKLNIQDIINGLHTKQILFLDEYPIDNSTFRLVVGKRSSMEGWSIVSKDNGIECFLAYQSETPDSPIQRIDITKEEYQACQDACYEQMKRF